MPLTPRSHSVWPEHITGQEGERETGRETSACVFAFQPSWKWHKWRGAGAADPQWISVSSVVKQYLVLSICTWFLDANFDCMSEHVFHWSAAEMSQVSLKWWQVTWLHESTGTMRPPLACPLQTDSWSFYNDSKSAPAQCRISPSLLLLYGTLASASLQPQID